MNSSRSPKSALKTFQLPRPSASGVNFASSVPNIRLFDATVATQEEINEECLSLYCAENMQARDLLNNSKKSIDLLNKTQPDWRNPYLREVVASFLQKKALSLRTRSPSPVPDVAPILTGSTEQKVSSFHTVEFWKSVQPLRSPPPSVVPTKPTLTKTSTKPSFEDRWIGARRLGMGGMF